MIQTIKAWWRWWWAQRRTRAARRLVLDLPESEPEWTERDAESLRRWLETESGQRYARLLRWQEHEVCRRAVRQRGAAEYAAGYAAGYSTGCALPETLAASVGPESDTEAMKREQSGLLGGKALAEILAP